MSDNWCVSINRVGVLNKDFETVGQNIQEGSLVFEAKDIYGCCTADQVAITLVRDIGPYIGIPEDLITWDLS